MAGHAFVDQVRTHQSCRPMSPRTQGPDNDAGAPGRRNLPLYPARRPSRRHSYRRYRKNPARRRIPPRRLSPVLPMAPTRRPQRPCSIKNGRLVLEAYFYGYDADRQQQLRSATKSWVARQAGIAIDHGGPCGPIAATWPRCTSPPTPTPIRASRRITGARLPDDATRA